MLAVGIITLVIILGALGGMFAWLMREAGPTTSARLNIYNLLRRGGWKEICKGLLVMTAVIIVVWFLLAL